MCFMCNKYGIDGQRWFLNPQRYARNMYRRVAPEKALKPGEEARARPYGGADPVQERIDELMKRRGELTPQEFEEAVIEDNEKIRQDGALAQVLTLEEALQVVDLSDPVALVACACRKEARAKLETNEDEYSCLGFGIDLLKWEQWPETYKGGVHIISHEEAKERLREAYDRGFCLALRTFDSGYIGGICVFQYPYFGPANDRVNYGLMASLLKGHQLASINFDLCNGCSICVQKCQFGGLTYEVGRQRIWLNAWSCYGCGLCTTMCPVGAIDMVDRTSAHMLKEAW